jgi:hypothetical protein
MSLPQSMNLGYRGFGASFSTKGATAFQPRAPRGGSGDQNATRSEGPPQLEAWRHLHARRNCGGPSDRTQPILRDSQRVALGWDAVAPLVRHLWSGIRILAESISHAHPGKLNGILKGDLGLTRMPAGCVASYRKELESNRHPPFVIGLRVERFFSISISIPIPISITRIFHQISDGGRGHDIADEGDSMRIGQNPARRGAQRNSRPSAYPSSPPMESRVLVRFQGR